MFKNLTFTLLLLAGTMTIAMAQINTPAASPKVKTTQTVGLTDVTIEYSRPGIKGRTIFGDLVPYDQIWRTGANSATKISFSDDVTINGNDLAKGSYAILTKPGISTWDIYFYPYEAGSWSSYREKTPTLTVTSESVTLPMSAMQNFFIGIDALTDDGANLEIVWDNVYVPMVLGVHTDKAVRADMDRVLNGPSAGDYYTAGNYLFSRGEDLEKALMYVQKATSGENPRFWQVRREALILAELGRTAEAITVAKKSLELAKAAGNNDYVRMNEKSIEEWSM